MYLHLVVRVVPTRAMGWPPAIYENSCGICTEKMTSNEKNSWRVRAGTQWMITEWDRRSFRDTGGLEKCGEMASGLDISL